MKISSISRNPAVVSLIAGLEALEAEHNVVAPSMTIKSSGKFVNLEDCRLETAECAEFYRLSRYEFGRALAGYKAMLPYSTWMPAVQIIATAIGVNERTIRNVLAAYEGAPLELVEPF